MERKNANIQTRISERESLEAKQAQLLERSARDGRAMIAAWVGATSIALVATAVMLAGCGQENASTKASSYTPAPASASQQNVVASNTGLVPTGGSGSLTQPSESSDELKSVPPDAIVSVSDTFVTAGQPIEVKVEGTADVTEMALSDGRGDALPMVRDSSGNVWRVNYRVPLRPRSDRLGLSVTAKNESNRWRRVWLFLQIDTGKQQVETETPDETNPEHK